MRESQGREKAMTESTGGDPQGKGSGHERSEESSPATYQDLLLETQRELQDEAAALRLLRHMAVIFDRDRLLQTLTFPLEKLGTAVADFLQAEPDAFADRYRLEEGLTACARHVLPGLLTPGFLEEVRRHVEVALRRRHDSMDQKALMTALILLAMEQTPEEIAANGLWNFVFRRSLLELMELPSRDVSLDPEVREALRMVPLHALHAPPPSPEPQPSEQLLEDVFHGLEAGYLEDHLGFSYLIRFPFALAILFPAGGRGPGRLSDPEAERRLMFATVESVAREGAQMGVVDEMLRLYRGARDAATGDRQRHFYSALVATLESFEPEENPVLPALYYEDYLHYLSGAMATDRSLIRDILDNPLDTRVYERYMAVLESRNQNAAATRVERIRDEVREWRARNQ